VTAYPTVDDVIGTHERLIAKFGGSLGIRDRGAIESALARTSKPSQMSLEGTQ